MQSPITYHAVDMIIQHARQAQIIIGTFLGAGDAAYRRRMRWLDCTARAKCDI